MVSATTCHATYRTDISGRRRHPLDASVAIGCALAAYPCRCAVSPRTLWNGARRARPQTRTEPRRPTLSGKRRAAGPADEDAEAAAGDHGRARSAASLKWLLIVGLVGAPGARRPVSSSLYQCDRHPGPQRGLRDADDLRLLRRRQDRARPVRRPRTASRSRSSEMPQNMQDAVVAAENQTFWTDKGIDPKGILRAAFSNARGNATPGRVDDHPAVRQDPLPDPGALLQAQDQGGDPLAEDPAAS